MSLFKLRPLTVMFGRSLHRLPAVETTYNTSWKKLPNFTRRHPDLLLNQLVQSDEKFDNEKWVKIREELLSNKVKDITAVNIDAVIVDTCCAMNKYQEALDYMNYLKSQNTKFNIAITGKYFKLLHKLKTDLTPAEEEEVLRLYDDIRKEYPVLETMTAEYCIGILGRTSRWRECLELAKMVQTSSAMHSSSFSSIIGGALRDNEPEIAWEHLRKMPPRLIPTKETYSNFVNYFATASKSAEEFDKNIQKLFNFFGDHDIQPWLETMQHFSDVMAKFGWTGKQTSIKTSGVCKNCGEQLEELNLTPGDFQHLSRVFMNEVVVGPDVYNKTTPTELRHFKSFLRTANPYDVVIDGLNVAYTLNNNKPTKFLGAELAKVIRSFKNQNRKILVLGRKHMRKWNEADMKYVAQNAAIFFANDSSQDDPYLLYATLHGGLNTYFVSRDMMRQHVHRLPDEQTRKIFKRWQVTRQIEIKQPTFKNRGSVVLSYPPNYLPIAQNDPNGWHVPCVENDVIRQPLTNEPSQHWYCLRKTTKSGS